MSTSTNTKVSIGAAHGAGHMLGVVCGLAAASGWVRRRRPPSWSTPASRLTPSRSAWWPASLWRAGQCRPCSRARARLLRSAREQASHRLRHSGRHALGRGQHAHRLRDPRRGPGHRLSAVEHQLLVGLLWGWLLFGELRGAHGKNMAKVLCWEPSPLSAPP